MYVPPRNAVLELSLSTTGSLQAAIDSAKHGPRDLHGDILSLQYVLYGKGETVYTVVVDYEKDEYKILMRWYSLSTIRLYDLISTIDRDGSIYILKLDKLKLDLYVVDIEQLLISLGDILREFDNETLTLYMERMEPSILYEPIRVGLYTIGKDTMHVRKKIVGKEEVIITTFRGYLVSDILNNVELPNSTIVFCTDTEKNVQTIGVDITLYAYSKYLDGNNKELLIGALLFSHPELASYDFSTAIDVHPFRALTIEKQRKTIKDACINRKKDEASATMESKYILGLIQ